jgi:hypothetical protein
MKSLKGWFARAFSEEINPRPERRSVPGLQALHWTGEAPGQNVVKDISASGIYLLTEERWTPGTVTPIVLTCADLPESSPDGHILVQTKSVRWGKDGIGLAFVLPDYMDLWLWHKDGKPEPVEILHEFRVARALAFLRGICPSATQGLKLLFREGLSNIRIESAVRIALRAEEMLAREPNVGKMQVSDRLVMRVVERGSWAEDDLTQQFWAGILTASCAVGQLDESNLGYIDILSEFAIIHTRVFEIACKRSKKVLADNGSLTALPVTLSAPELMEIADAHDLIKIDRNLLQLSDHGLLEPRVKSKYFSFEEDAILTATPFGLAMYARCHGHRGTPQQFYS